MDGTFKIEHDQVGKSSNKGKNRQDLGLTWI